MGKSLEQFVSEQRKSLDVFEGYWNVHNLMDEERYPLRMEEADWNEQFQIFVSLLKEREKANETRTNPS